MIRYDTVMSKFNDIGVEKDHIEAQTKAIGITALSELIWNSLDLPEHIYPTFSFTILSSNFLNSFARCNSDI